MRFGNRANLPLLADNATPVVGQCKGAVLFSSLTCRKFRDLIKLEPLATWADDSSVNANVGLPGMVVDETLSVFRYNIRVCNHEFEVFQWELVSFRLSRSFVVVLIPLVSYAFE